MSTPGTDFSMTLSVGGQALDMALALDITMREGENLLPRFESCLT